MKATLIFIGLCSILSGALGFLVGLGVPEPWAASPFIVGLAALLTQRYLP